MKAVLSIVSERLAYGENLENAFAGFPLVFPKVFLTYLSIATITEEIRTVFENIEKERI